jgi:hypothetical protein
LTRAKTERALIYWADETAVAEHVRGIRGYAPMGKTPVLAAPTKRYGLTMISVSPADLRSYPIANTPDRALEGFGVSLLQKSVVVRYFFDFEHDRTFQRGVT